MDDRFTPPYIGAAYYPELWGEAEVDKEIARMLDLGINLARVGEFAWRFMEPKEGTYDFGWLHGAVGRLQEAGIAVVMCTPTAAPPAWLTQRYPETLLTEKDLVPNRHGGRRHYCYSSPKYRLLGRRITKKLAAEFAGYPCVVGWQLDNEFDYDCYCDTCQRAFREWLKDAYGTIDNLNRRWGAGIWSNWYDDFDQISLAIKAWHSASLIYKWRNFISDSYASFAREQAQIIRKHSTAPVTTNGMPAVHHRLDYEELFKSLDIAGIDVYAPLDTLALEFDWMRPLKKRPYWVLETGATWKPSGALRAKMWLAYALGGEAVSFWPLRAQWSGQEMGLGGVLYSFGEPTLCEKELRQVKEELHRVRDLVNETTPKKPELAVHYSYQSMWVFYHWGPDKEINYDDAFAKVHGSLACANIPRDLIFQHAEVNDYRAVCTPLMPVVTDELLSRMMRFVNNGGTWILGPLSAYRTEDNTCYPDKMLGSLEDRLGLHLRHRILLDDSAMRMTWANGESTTCHLCADGLEIKGQGTVLSRYADGPLQGMASVVEIPFGKGRIAVLGTLPDPARLGTWAAGYAGLSAGSVVASADRGIVVTERADAQGTVAATFVIDVAGTGGKVGLLKPGVDVLSGRELAGEVTMGPYDVLVIK